LPKREKMAHDKKLTKEILLNALGKTEDTPEVQKLFQILGQADIDEDTQIDHQIYGGKRYTYFDVESGIFIHSWDKYGIEMHLQNEDTLYPKNYLTSQIPVITTFLLYIKTSKEWGDKSSCLPICNDDFFYEGMKIEDIPEKYGEANKTWSSEKKNIGFNKYYNLEGFQKISVEFLFNLDTHEIFRITIELEEK